MTHRNGLIQSAAGNVVDAVFDAVGETLVNDEEVRIVGYLKFTTKSRPTRRGRSPRTGERLEIKASSVSTIKPGKTFTDAVNEGNGS